MSETDKEAMLALSLRFHDQISNIADTLDDEGDRVYLGSTNDADTLRDIAATAQDLQWSKDEPPVDWAACVKTLAAERDRLQARVAELEGALKPFAFLDSETPQEAWDLSRNDRFKDWISYEEIEHARQALKETSDD